jgi:hypothetical protein
MTDKRPRGRPKADTPAKTSAERSKVQRERQRAEGTREVAVVMSWQTQDRLAWLMQQHVVANKPVTISEAVGRCVKFTFDHAADLDGTKPSDL